MGLSRGLTTLMFLHLFGYILSCPIPENRIENITNIKNIAGTILKQSRVFLDIYNNDFSHIGDSPHHVHSVPDPTAENVTLEQLPNIFKGFIHNLKLVVQYEFEKAILNHFKKLEQDMIVAWETMGFPTQDLPFVSAPTTDLAKQQRHAKSLLVLLNRWLEKIETSLSS